MPSTQENPSPQHAEAWYVLNHIARPGLGIAEREVDRFNAWQQADLRLFAPTYVVREEKAGDIKFRTANLTFHYVFVRGAFDEVKRLCAESNGFSFLLDRSSDGRYAVIDDERMAAFQNIARAYRNCLPYFPLGDIDLEDGDLVEVIRGDFPGLVGRYMPKPGARSGNIVLNVYNKVGTIAFDVRATDVRVLEFSRNTRRANDQIDAFVPHLLDALRHRHDRPGEPLPEPLVARLSVFSGRMEVARLGNRKLDARLQILLYGAFTLIGDTAAAASALEKYHKLQSSVTNDWTRALITLILSLLTRDKTQLESTYAKLKELRPDSAMKKRIKSEYDHYCGGNTPTGL